MALSDSYITSSKEVDGHINVKNKTGIDVRERKKEILHYWLMLFDHWESGKTGPTFIYRNTWIN